ncbi:MAG: hypothetical protein AABM67_16840 [Acidobacteriota bacterium]
MTTITHRRYLVLALVLLGSLIMFYQLRPVQGRAQEDDLKGQVKALTQKVVDQKKEIDSLRQDLGIFKAQVVQRYNDTKDLVNKHDSRLNAGDQKFGAISESLRRQDQGLRQQDQGLRQYFVELTQQRNRIASIEARLRARGM